MNRKVNVHKGNMKADGSVVENNFFMVKQREFANGMPTRINIERNRTMELEEPFIPYPSVDGEMYSPCVEP